MILWSSYIFPFERMAPLRSLPLEPILLVFLIVLSFFFSPPPQFDSIFPPCVTSPSPPCQIFLRTSGTFIFWAVVYVFFFLLMPVSLKTTPNPPPLFFRLNLPLPPSFNGLFPTLLSQSFFFLFSPLVRQALRGVN